MTPSHVITYSCQSIDIHLKYTDGVMMPSQFSTLLARALPAPPKMNRSSTALDLGTGSGIQAILLAKLGWNDVYAIDIDKRCLAAAEFNSLLNKVSEYAPTGQAKVTAIHSDKFEKIAGLKFDLIVSNPPSLPSTEETPAFASGGPSGRDFIDAMITHAAQALNPGGQLVFVHSSLADIQKTIVALKAEGFAVETLCSKRIPFRDFYMPHLFFYRRMQALSSRSIYSQDTRGMLFERISVIRATRPRRA